MDSLVILSTLTITTVFGDGHVVNCTKEEDCECADDVSECTINCIGEDQCKDTEISCNEVDLCTINCIGNNACSGNTEIDGTDASTVTLFCDGKDSCKGNVELYCGEGDCSISCVNATSCESIDIDADDASSFECSGYCDVSDDIPDSFTPSTTQGFVNSVATSTDDASAESTESTETSSTETSTANVQVMGGIGAQSNGEAFAQNEEHYHDVGGHATHIPMLLIIVVGAVALICFCVLAFWCRLRLSAPKTHERVQSGIALDDLDMEMEEEEDEVHIVDTDMGTDMENDHGHTDYGDDYEYGMVHTGYGCVEPGTFTAGRTDEMCMLPH